MVLVCLVSIISYVSGEDSLRCLQKGKKSVFTKNVETSECSPKMIYVRALGTYWHEYSTSVNQKNCIAQVLKCRLTKKINIAQKIL